MKSPCLKTYDKIKFAFMQLRNICVYLRSSAVCILKSDNKNHREHRENWQRTQLTQNELMPLEFVLVRTSSLFFSCFMGE